MKSRTHQKTVQFIGYQEMSDGNSFPIFNDETGTTISLQTLERDNGNNFRIENMHVLYSDTSKQFLAIGFIELLRSRPGKLTLVTSPMVSLAHIFCPCEHCQVVIKGMMQKLDELGMRFRVINISDAREQFAPETPLSEFFRV